MRYRENYFINGQMLALKEPQSVARTLEANDKISVKNIKVIKRSYIGVIMVNILTYVFDVKNNIMTSIFYIK